ncbi:suppressor APC domain-containing protein 1-like isoform X2 [Tachysurus fulvidraco]|uniref:suppressor APC domain-containing protein 1-like isoform X2 n=1 Tax=Tachysurus fulvidraco TaxID=1234273 RepID=UPI001FEDCFD6|nr:suppressor APC domain-containing protein 1-like isoform X2 [Tachysurus fulvidraco]
MASYTVMIVPLRSNSLDSLRFFLWVKQLQELERQKDITWLNLQTSEQTQYCIRSRPERNIQTGKMEEDTGTQKRTRLIDR